ncbi:MAG: O-antigen ligase family protein [Coriobacteriia bacterium]|nr:O-antigen ligase family protein [Coriobacteriia bacterium]
MLKTRAAARNRFIPSDLAWLAVAILAGGLAGASTALGVAGMVVLGVAGLVLLTFVVAAVLAKPERGMWLMLLAIPLDTAGRLIASPMVVTVYQVTLLMTLGAWGVRWLTDPVTARPRWSVLDIGIATLVAGAIWSLPGSLAPAATAISALRLVFLWLFFLLFVTWIRNEGSLRRVIILVVGTGCLTSLVALAQYALPGLPLGYTHQQVAAGGIIVRPAAFFDDPNYLATMLSFGIIAAIGMAIAARRVAHSAVWLLTTVVMSGGLFVTLSRTGWLGVMAGLVPLVLTARTDRRRWLMAISALLVVVALLAAPGAIVSRLASIGDVEGDASIRTRYLMLASSVEMIGDHWVFGTGLSAYEVAYPPYRLLGARYDIHKPHQLPLAMWVEMGIVGLVAELLIIGGVVWMLVRRRHRGWNVYEAIGLAGILAIFVQSLFQYYLYFEYLWLSLALIAVATRLPASTEEVS